MIITLKTLKQQTFKIEVEENESVCRLKICLPKYKFSLYNQNIMYNCNMYLY